MNAISDFSIRLEKSIKRFTYEDVPLEDLQGELLENAIEEYEQLVKTLKKKRAAIKRAESKRSLKEPDLPEKSEKNELKVSGKAKKK